MDLWGRNLVITLCIDSTYGLYTRRFSPKNAENIPEVGISSFNNPPITSSPVSG